MLFLCKTLISPFEAWQLQIQAAIIVDCAQSLRRLGPKNFPEGSNLQYVSLFAAKNTWKSLCENTVFQ